MKSVFNEILRVESITQCSNSTYDTMSLKTSRQKLGQLDGFVEAAKPQIDCNPKDTRTDRFNVAPHHRHK